MLAMDVNDNAGCLNDRVVQTLFASKLAPTRKRAQLRSGRQADGADQDQKPELIRICRSEFARDGRQR
ncbi:hypothetical protein DOZ80_23690 [Pseudomonas fluorescens]|uniref:Uncharacterized protein n=1 Tax=Pseudomonas fluorescens TaxID=294 RepID=A0A327MUP3_PSEFL|nr:hypothetical protein DOZ80_23690 [Pseudomonas fluorescens]